MEEGRVEKSPRYYLRSVRRLEYESSQVSRVSESPTHNIDNIINNRTTRTNYVNEGPINITYDCNVVIRMRNLALMKATGPKHLPFI